MNVRMDLAATRTLTASIPRARSRADVKKALKEMVQRNAKVQIDRVLSFITVKVVSKY